MGRIKALLLGNSINQAYGCRSWENLLGTLSEREIKESHLPMPLKPIVMTGNKVHSKMREYSETPEAYGKIDNEEMRNMLRALLMKRFDAILTTNYSYELEIAASDNETISKYQLDKIAKRADEKKHPVEGKYFIHTYNEVEFSGVKNNIWHIHGAAKNPSSMIIGHYYYGNLLGKYKEYFDREAKNRYSTAQKKGEIKISSWLDAFVLGDVYVLGFGFDFSEFDLWWLLDRKKREKAEHGKLYYYVPSWEANSPLFMEKEELFRCYDAEVIRVEHTKNDYKGYLEKTIKML